MNLAKGNLVARQRVLNPIEHPISRTSLMMQLFECMLWCCSMASSHFPRIISFASSAEASGNVLLAIEIVAASASAAAYDQQKNPNLEFRN